MRARTVLALGFLVACHEPTALTFVVTTDVPCDHVSSTAIAVGTLGDFETRPFTATSVVCKGGSLGSLVVIPGSAKEIAVRIVTGLDGKTPDACAASGYSGGCIVARRALSFISGSPIAVPVKMEASCRDVACQPNQTCSKGGCVAVGTPCTDAQCSPSDPKPPSHWVTMRPGSAGGVGPRGSHSTVWTGHEMIVFAGVGQGGTLDDGGIYDPRADTWRLVPKGPLESRSGHVAVWTGTEMIVWGGSNGSVGTLANGARFDPKTSAWTSIASVPPAFDGPGRNDAAAVWAPTTGEMIVWGGLTSPDESATGAAYKPSTNTWRMLAPSPLARRTRHTALWVTDKVLFFGGQANADGAFYDPKTDTWSGPFASSLVGRSVGAAAWSGDPTEPVALFGGENSSAAYFDDGVTFDPISRQYDPLQGNFWTSPRGDAGGWMSNHRFWVWGGRNSKTDVAGDGAYYDLSSRTWISIPDGGPSPRANFSTVWTGTEAIVWGGADGTESTFYDDGARFTQ